MFAMSQFLEQQSSARKHLKEQEWIPCDSRSKGKIEKVKGKL